MTNASVLSPSSDIRPASFVVGIDAGGTHSRARVANERGDILGAGEAGPGNPHVGGMDAARREILTAIQRACDDAHIAKQNLTSACLGAAGVSRPDERAEWTTWATQEIAPRIAICNDGEILIAAGSPENWGAGLIAGTGSSAWGKTRDGRIARAGGWGWLFGDEGSGFELARQALRAASQFADGRAERTSLLDAILAFWNLREPQELIGRVYRSGLKNADIAVLAGVVVRAANEGDAVALRLIAETGDALAMAIGAVAHSLQIEREQIPLALTGGLLLDAPIVRERLLASTRERGLNFAPVTLVTDPVLGAVRIATELLGRG